MIASSEGGVNIEDVAASKPDAIIKVPIDIKKGFDKELAKEAAAKIGIPAARTDEVADILINLYDLFQSKDATMVEINPFAEDSNGKCEATLVFAKTSVLNSIFCRFLFGRQDPIR